MPQWAKATLKTRTDKNGYEWIKEDIPLGKEYCYQVSSKRIGRNLNTTTGEEFDVEIVTVLDGDHEAYMPVDCLDFGQTELLH